VRLRLRVAWARCRDALLHRGKRIDAPTHGLTPQGWEEPPIPKGTEYASELPSGQGTPPEVVMMLADVATSLWRLRLRMVKPGTETPIDAMMRPFRDLQAAWDAFSEGGLEIVDHTGEAIPEAGDYRLHLISFQPTDGLTTEKVIETLKPTIRFQGKVVQIGEVIVGTPRQAEEN